VVADEQSEKRKLR